MKKAIIILMLFVSAATVFTSCKKEEKKSEKERVTELLVSGKWYYQSFGSRTCFNSNDYWEFKSNGSVTETWDFDQNMNFTVSENGKTITVIEGSRTFDLTITSINTTAFAYSREGDGIVNVVLGKTALNCNPK